ncbi:MAG TPA: DinB family protein [Rubricoccaceae bacterium]
MTQPLRDVAFGDLAAELAITRRVLERLPEDHLGWAPHEKSKTLGSLGAHVALLPAMLAAMLTTDEFDVAAPRPPAPQTAGAILAAFDQTSAALAAAVAAASDEDLAGTWTLRSGPRVITSGTRAANLRTLGLSHMAHHRGQLTVYLRLLDVPVPSVYGPSADEGR